MGNAALDAKTCDAALATRAASIEERFGEELSAGMRLHARLSRLFPKPGTRARADLAPLATQHSGASLS